MYFSNKGKSSIEERLKEELFAYSYEKNWEALSERDREFLLLLANQKNHKRKDILARMGEKKNNYSVYRDTFEMTSKINQKTISFLWLMF